MTKRWEIIDSIEAPITSVVVHPDDWFHIIVLGCKSPIDDRFLPDHVCSAANEALRESSCFCGGKGWYLTEGVNICEECRSGEILKREVDRLVTEKME